MRQKFSWQSTSLTTVLFGLTVPIVLGANLFPKRGISLLGLPIMAVALWAIRNHRRYLRVDERGVRLMQENVGAKSRVLWHVEPRELKTLRRDPKGLTLVTETGRERTIRLTPTPFGGWRDPEELEAAIRERMTQAPAVIDSRLWRPEPPTPTT